VDEVIFCWPSRLMFRLSIENPANRANAQSPDDVECCLGHAQGGKTER
jgi:hypothetical protein